MLSRDRNCKYFQDAEYSDALRLSMSVSDRSTSSTDGHELSGARRRCIISANICALHATEAFVALVENSIDIFQERIAENVKFQMTARLDTTVNLFRHSFVRILH